MAVGERYVGKFKLGGGGEMMGEMAEGESYLGGMSAPWGGGGGGGGKIMGEMAVDESYVGVCWKGGGQNYGGKGAGVQSYVGDKGANFCRGKDMR